MADKDVAGVLSALAASPVARAARVLCTEVVSPRALSATSLARGWAAVAPGSRPEVATPPERALEQALRDAPGPIVVAGSLYLVGAVRALLVDDPLLRDLPLGDPLPLDSPPLDPLAASVAASPVLAR